MENAGNKRNEFALNTEKWTNWAKVKSCTPQYIHHPQSIEELRHILEYARTHGEKVKVVGFGHSPADIACTNGHMIKLDKMNKIIQIDVTKKLIKVEGGILLHQVNAALEKHALALGNLGSISDQSVAGAIATGTHGSSSKYGILATHVVEIEVMCANGSVLTASKREHPDLFRCLQCHLGALGIIVSATIACEPAFNLHAVEYPLPLKTALSDISSITSADYARMWWFPHTDKCSVWQANKTTKSVTPSKGSWFGSLVDKFLGSLVDKFLGYHLLELLLYLATFLPSMVPWINRWHRWMFFSRRKEKIDTSYKIFNFDCLFKQYVSEWSVPVENVAKAMDALQHIINKYNLKAHFPVEVRFVAKDDIPLSPAYGRNSCFIGIIVYNPWGKLGDWNQYFTEVGHMMAALDGRPHWGKEFPPDLDFHQMYPEWDKFISVKRQVDPQDIFSNEYLDRLFN